MPARRLLLVETNSTLRCLVSTVLEQAGFEVEIAVDGREGLARIRANPPDLFVTDFSLPELSGADICREIKADRELRAIPVLLLTTASGGEQTAEALDAGADGYIEAPDGPDEVQVLLARIRSALRIADLPAELIERNRLLEVAHKKLQLELELARRVRDDQL